MQKKTRTIILLFVAVFCLFSGCTTNDTTTKPNIYTTDNGQIFNLDVPQFNTAGDIYQNYSRYYDTYFMIGGNLTIFSYSSRTQIPTEYRFTIENYTFLLDNLDIYNVSDGSYLIIGKMKEPLNDSMLHIEVILSQELKKNW